MRRRRAIPLGVLSSLAVAVPLAVTGGQAPANAVQQVNTTALREAVTVGGVLQHERVFQRIANNNDGNRASGTSGYDRSAAYVAKRLEAAGYNVTVQEFTFPRFTENSPATLTQDSPVPTEYDTTSFEYSGSGTVTGQVFTNRDTQIPPPEEAGTTTSGCEPSSFEPAPTDEDAVALAQRGTCDFGTKAQNAADAGYDAIIIFNEGQEGRTELIEGTLGAPVDIPAVALSYEDGAALNEAAEAGEVVVTVTTDTEFDPEARTSNVLATTKGGDRDKTVVVGAHLDSVPEGAGINDNGSGSATILEIAEEMSEAKVKPRQKVRFAFWGAEESGLLGSEHYVDSLSDNQLARIVANLNFDMVGSPNYVRFVYDGDGSDSEPAGPAGSAQIEDLFVDYFDSQNLASAPTQFSGRSDYGPFIAVGIPAGGLFTGAEGVKTAEEAAVFGGTAGEAYDSCYHQACDDINNLNTDALSEMGDAATHAVATLALSRTGFFDDGSFRKAPKQRDAQRATLHQHGNHLSR